MALLANSFSAEAGGNCQSKLVGNSYSCNSDDQDLGAAPVTFSFSTGGLSDNFDLLIDSADYGCSCNTTGPLNSPNFDSSPITFECISLSTGYLVSGKVTGKKIKGQGTSVNGDGVIFTCTKS